MYTETDVRVTDRENAFKCLIEGWKLYAITKSAEDAGRFEVELSE